MPGGSSKRKLKRLKRESGEAQDVVKQCSVMLANFGIPVSFAWEIPQKLQMLLTGQLKPVAGSPGTESDPSMTFERLEAIAAGRPVQPVAAPPPAQIPYQAPLQAAPPAHGVAAQQQYQQPPVAPPVPQPEADPWAAAAARSLGEAPPLAPGAAAPMAPPATSGPARAAAPPMSSDDMAAHFAAGQARMQDRVATAGVVYKHGATGPASGQRLQPVADPRAVPALPQPPTQPSPRGAASVGIFGDDLDDLGSVGGTGAAPGYNPSFDQTVIPVNGGAQPLVDQAQAPPENGGGSRERVNPVTGLTLTQQRRLIQAATGRTPGSQGAADGVTKPPGI